MWDAFPSLETPASSAENEKKNPGSDKLPSEEAIFSFKHKRHGISYLVGLEGTVATNGGCALFPEYMKSEFHGVRATIEAYSNKGKLEQPGEGKDASFVGGVSIGRKKGGKIDKEFRVTNSTGRMERYEIVLFE